MTGLNRFATVMQGAQPRAHVFALLLASATLAHAAAGEASPAPRLALDTTTCSRPVYPEENARLKNAGTVTLQFLIDTDGRVLESKLQKSSGHRGLDEAARSGLSKCRFKPPMVDGKPVRAWTAVQYVWTPE